jgi:hypothetical protein
MFIMSERRPVPKLLQCCAFFLLGGSLLLSGCTTLLTGTVIKPAVGNLQRQQDVELVCEGAAAYLLMIDSLIESAPDNRQLLLLGAQSYSGSIAALESCQAPLERRQALGEKAKFYGQRLLATLSPGGLSPQNPKSLDAALHVLTAGDALPLFWAASGWLAWIGQQQGAPAAMADLPIVEQLMAKTLELDETVQNGSAHLFFGVLYGTKPAMAGGDPERSRFHFERALELSGRSLLLVQASYAQTYARMVFDRELHDRLLQEVLDFPLEQQPEHTLLNQIAKRKARQLLAEDYFAGS